MTLAASLSLNISNVVNYSAAVVKTLERKAKIYQQDYHCLFSLSNQLPILSSTETINILSTKHEKILNLVCYNLQWAQGGIFTSCFSTFSMTRSSKIPTSLSFSCLKHWHKQFLYDQNKNCQLWHQFISRP